ncbi:MAG TPA: hypothetical protein VGU20_11480 [Stellaceae bacterium]|nr:hypothetical protein [Stellaceae bacterium]
METRSVDVAGLAAPTWEQVLDRHYEPWDRPHLVVDTAHRTPEEALAELQFEIGRHTTSRERR